MPTPLEYMQLRAPAFAALPEIATWLDYAEQETGDSYCSDDPHRNKAIFLLAAHQIALNQRNEDGGGSAPSGSIKSEKEGDLARSYGVESNDSNQIDPYLAQTSWGVELWNLQRSCFFLPRTRMQ